MLSIIPDIDIVIPFLEHRGPTHSVLMALMIFIPIFAVYQKKAIPYFFALIQHSLIGDYISGGRIQLFWPVTTGYYGIEIGITSQTNIMMEWIFFVASLGILLATGDMTKLFKPHTTNLILTVPTFTVLMPTFLSFPLEVPASLILPHLFYFITFIVAITVTFLGIQGILPRKFGKIG